MWTSLSCEEVKYLNLESYDILYKTSDMAAPPHFQTMSKVYWFFLSVAPKRQVKLNFLEDILLKKAPYCKGYCFRVQGSRGYILKCYFYFHSTCPNPTQIMAALNYVLSFSFPPTGVYLSPNKSPSPPLLSTHLIIF